ncbi:hypothetical protein MBLNU459_g0674t1 [Dothideomycetes sp. NU459]
MDDQSWAKYPHLVQSPMLAKKKRTTRKSSDDAVVIFHARETPTLAVTSAAKARKMLNLAQNRKTPEVTKRAFRPHLRKAEVKEEALTHKHVLPGDKDHNWEAVKILGRGDQGMVILLVSTDRNKKVLDRRVMKLVQIRDT